MQETLTTYGAGLTVTSINLNVVDYPRSVQSAVDDTQKARNDRDRYKLEATTYANDIIPRARGQAQRVLQDAEAYRDRVVADAEGEASRFEALLTEYLKAPKVTRDRLYLDAVEFVYTNSNKIIVDSEGSGSLMYLPLDQLMKNAAKAGANTPPVTSPDTRSDARNNTDTAVVDTSRDRRTRE